MYKSNKVLVPVRIFHVTSLEAEKYNKVLLLCHSVLLNVG